MLTDTIDLDYGEGWEKVATFLPTESALTDIIDKQEEYEFVSIGGELVPKAGLKDFASSLKEQKEQICQSVANHFETILSAIPFPSRWKKEGIQEPTEECRRKALSVAEKIFLRFHIQPFRIASSIEEGLMLVYWDPSKSRSLKIEIYNSLSVAGLINENKTIVKSLNIISDDHIRELCRDFTG